MVDPLQVSIMLKAVSSWALSVVLNAREGSLHQLPKIGGRYVNMLFSVPPFIQVVFVHTTFAD